MKISKVFFIFLIILANFLLLWPLFKKGFIVSDDGDLMLIRLGATIRALRDGHFPIRILDLNNGYGYPVLNFLYPLPFYVGSVIYFFSRLGLINAYKISIILYSIIGSLGAFYLGKSITKKNFPSFVCAIFYLFFPSTTINIFYRSSIGELLALSLLPFIFLFLQLYREKKNKHFLLLISLFLFLIILSHNILALLTIGTIILFNIFIYKDKNIYYYLILGVLSSSFFSLPAFLERNFTHSQEIALSNINDRFLSLKNLIRNLPIFSNNLTRIENIFSLPLLLALSVLISITLFFGKWLKKEDKFMIGYVLVLIFLTLDISKTLWETVLSPFIPFIQFPWRVFGIVAIILTILLGRILVKIKKNYFLIIILVLMIFLGVNSWQLSRHKEVNDNFYFTNQSSSTTRDEFTPIWVKDFPKNRPLQLVELNNPATKISDLNIKTQKINFVLESDNETEVTINKHYYPGWTLFIDNQKEGFNIESQTGTIKFILPRGQHKIVLLFKEGSLRLISDVISLVALSFLLYIFLLERNK